jgi:hypothetical protein
MSILHSDGVRWKYALESTHTAPARERIEEKAVYKGGLLYS